ncbi:MAG: 16S rRNA (cytosine(1402)-N(4))-methyltransferase RsmH [Gammaproteobacteria bacterium]|nr:16S rRNA (cytosine(1402)-N(4))-methyltransferase RsmH [Gammaproteobacteria bacterium]
MPVTHTPVLVEETVEALVVKPNGTFFDATFGGGGHTRCLLDKLDAKAQLLVADRDPSAIEGAKSLALEDERVKVVHGRFSDAKKLAHENEFQVFDGILMDLGLSSTQLDEAERGFSFLRDGPLDMRMDPTAGFTASEWLNRVSVGELTTVFKRYGEERNSRPIAQAIVAARPLETTFQLVDVISRASRKVDSRKHVATRVFQAIRIHINDEINELRKGLRQVFDLLGVNARLAVISFHSFEHQVVRRQFSEWSKDPIPRRAPVRGKHTGPFKVVVRERRPSRAEIESNIRARSAKLQVVERVR